MCGYTGMQMQVHLCLIHPYSEYVGITSDILAFIKRERTETTNNTKDGFVV